MPASAASAGNPSDATGSARTGRHRAFGDALAGIGESASGTATSGTSNGPGTTTVLGTSAPQQPGSAAHLDALPGAAASQASTNVTSPATTAATSPTAPAVTYQSQAAPLHQQVAGPILQLRAHGDGTHRMMIELHPADLGQVNVEVRIREGQLSIALAGGSDEARDSIRASLPELRAELSSAGLGQVAVSVDSGAAGNNASPQQQAGRPAAGERRLEDVEPALSPRSGHPSSTSIPSLTGVDRWL